MKSKDCSSFRWKVKEHLSYNMDPSDNLVDFFGIAQLLKDKVKFFSEKVFDTSMDCYRFQYFRYLDELFEFRLLIEPHAARSVAFFLAACGPGAE